MKTSHWALVALLIGVLTGCAPAPSSGDGPLRVLAAETFLADIAGNVTGDRVSVDSLLAPGADPHTYQPTPADVILISQARLFIINGLGYESWLQNVLPEDGGDTGLTTGAAGDPHLWMDPRNVEMYVANIQEALSTVDPDGGPIYAANAEAYVAELRELDAWIRREVESLPPGRRILVTNHDALESFATAYGFEVAGAILPSYSTGAAPSAQQIAGLIETIQEGGVPAIFLDASENPSLAEQIAAESGAQVVTGLHVGTLSIPGGDADSYIGMMKSNVRQIVDALR
jgi:ABC-type Zn uptake system ZnuABC Zn-binding protein ZnuA